MSSKPGFEEISRYYDFMYVNETTYQKEVEAVVDIVDKYKPAHCKTVLDIACGTGAQAVYLAEHYEVTGIDLSPEMLNIAKGKVLEATFVEADMFNFELNRKFDIIVNLYGSIGFAESYEQLCAASQCAYQHLHDGGLYILTPWGTKESLVEGLVAKSKKVERSGYCRMETVKRIADDKVQVEMHHLVANDLDVSYYTNVSTITLFSEEQYVRSLKNADFKIIERLSPKEFRMGAFICRKNAS